MACDGELLRACGVIDIDLSETWIVAVSGDPRELHALLKYFINLARPS